MSNLPKMTLPDEPLEALSQIAGYLRTVNMRRGDAICEVERDGQSRLSIGTSSLEDPSIIGHWQCKEWLEGLLELADECDRIRGREVSR